MFGVKSEPVMDEYVLIIDFSSNMRMFLREAFKRFGYCVIEAPDCEEGLHLAMANQYSRIIVNIATINLYEADYCKELRNKCPDTAVFALVHYGGSHDTSLASDVYKAVASIVA
jgi:DNA-binding response OmpR family regulator